MSDETSVFFRRADEYDPRLRVVVLAANYEQADDWRRSVGLAPRQIIYFADAYRLEGRRIRAGEIALVDGWSSHRDAERIAQVLLRSAQVGLTPGQYAELRERIPHATPLRSDPS